MISALHSSPSATARDGRLTFTAPPPGFAPLTDFDLAAVDGAPGLYTLRDTAGADLRLFLLDPTYYVPEYLPAVADEDLAALGASSVGEVDVYVVANISDGAPVVNLLAPIVVNPASGSATQLILEDDWPLQAELVTEAA
jgi:flagellar assembly factor FliW